MGIGDGLELARHGVRALDCGALDAGMLGLLQAVKAYERLAIEAATTGSHAAALKALVVHPLVPNVQVAHTVLGALVARGLLPSSEVSS